MLLCMGSVENISGSRMRILFPALFMDTLKGRKLTVTGWFMPFSLSGATGFSSSTTSRDFINPFTDV